MKVGYVRVSTAEQNTARQEVIMEQLGVEKVFMDKMSGKNTDRPQLQEMLSFVREGDTLVVESISRLARSTKDLLSIMEELDKKKVKFVSQKESIDTSTPNGVFMMTIFAAMAQLERETMLARQREGIEIAKAEGKYRGRKPVEVDEEKFRQLYNDWQNGKSTPKIMMNELGLKPTTFWRKVKEYREKYGITDAATTRKYVNKNEK
nr:MAG TPA: gamma delta Resolvase, site specific recombination [Caudoviricetes sp.]DAO82455.1 MAG TPA: gamma delta Resolvase, site specific recombination [Caudoviricetes sp.]